MLGGVVARSVLVTCALAALVVLAAPAAASSADRLVLQPREAGGLLPGKARPGAARTALLAILDRGPVAAPRPQQVDVSVYQDAARERRLELQAFVFASAAQARKAARAWRRAQPVARRVRGRSVITIVDRAGAVLTLVRYRSPSLLAAARTVALDFADAQAARVERVAARSVADRVLDGVRADGSIPTPTLLQLAALVYGPVEGVTLPPGAAPGDPRLDATTLTQALLAAAPDLTPGQLRALGRARAAGAPRVAAPAAAQRAPREAGACQPVSAGTPLDPVRTSEAIALRAAIASRMTGISLHQDWRVCVYAYPGWTRGLTNAETAPWNTAQTASPFASDFFDRARRNLGSQDACMIGLFAPFFHTSPQNQQMQLAHEAYHCLHAEWLLGSVLTSQHNPYWTEESLASWAGHQVAPGTYEPANKVPGEHFRGWNSHTATPLFELGYMAWGFLGLVEQVAGTTQVWNRIAHVWLARSDSPAVFAATVASNEADVLDTWGAAHFRQPAFPAAWMQRLPFAVPDTGGADFNKTTIHAVPARIRLEVLPYRAEMFVLHGTESPLVEVAVEGYGRVTDGQQEWVHPSSLWVCFQGRCTCPPGQHARTAIPASTAIGASLYAGVAAGARASALVVHGHEMSEFCEPDRPPTPPPGPGAGGGHTHSDPHLVTFDGLAYDLQSAGEFVLARADDSSFEAQVRQESIDDLRVASSNTAVAMRMDGHRIGVSGGRDLTLRVDGRVRPLGAEERLEVGTVAIRRYADTFLVRSADGTQVTVDGWRRSALRIAVDPSDALRSRLRGTLGSNDGDAGNDLTTSRGARIAYTLPAGGDLRVPRFESGTDDFGWIHGPYADSWRVRQADSLFEYGPGQSTATFTDRSVPVKEVTLADLTALVRNRARRACASIEDPWFRKSCVRDVALTGDAGYAATAGRAEQGRGGWRPMDGFESRIGPLSGLLAGDGTVLFAAQTAIFGAETLATAVAVPRGAGARAPFLIDRGQVGDPSLYRTADGGVAATLPAIDPLTGTGSIRTYTLPASGPVTRGADIAALSDLRGAVPGVIGPAGLLTAANGAGTIDVRLGTDPAAAAIPAATDGTDCLPSAPGVAAGGGAVWLAWTGVLCTAGGPRAVLLSPTGQTALGPLRAPGAPAGILLPTTLSTPLAVRPDGSARMTYAADGRVLVWPVDPGEEAIEVASTGRYTTDTTLIAAEPTSGRVWVAWRDPASRALHIRRSDADGRRFGAAQTLAAPLTVPEDDRRRGEWTIVADDARLIVAFAVPGTSGRAGSAWYATLKWQPA